jgi:hypothetical protein
MVLCKIITPEGKCGGVKVDIDRSIEHIKKGLCEELELGNPDSYILAFYAKDEGMLIKNIVEYGCTIVIEKRIQLAEAK